MQSTAIINRNSICEWLFIYKEHARGWSSFEDIFCMLDFNLFLLKKLIENFWLIPKHENYMTTKMEHLMLDVELPKQTSMSLLLVFITPTTLNFLNTQSLPLFVFFAVTEKIIHLVNAVNCILFYSYFTGHFQE
jgi:hypothetical protein